MERKGTILKLFKIQQKPVKKISIKKSIVLKNIEWYGAGLYYAGEFLNWSLKGSRSLGKQARLLKFVSAHQHFKGINRFIHL